MSRTRGRRTPNRLLVCKNHEESPDESRCMVSSLRSKQPLSPLFVLTEQLHVQTNGPHEEVDIVQALAGHVGRERLAVANGFHHAIPREKIVSMDCNPDRLL